MLEPLSVANSEAWVELFGALAYPLQHWMKSFDRNDIRGLSLRLPSDQLMLQSATPSHHSTGLLSFLRAPL